MQNQDFQGQIDNIIRNLQLIPHPEGGYFRETYRSKEEVIPGNNYSGKRNFSTCIYYLLDSESFSAFHKIRQDEIWHFYTGFPLVIHMISDSGSYTSIIISNNIEKGHVPQFVVPGNTWFAAHVLSINTYSLVGCTVSPGFDYSDFVLGKRLELIQKFPRHKDIILKYTRA
jgi:predicted cupin superfamily sugar epimerase